MMKENTRIMGKRSWIFPMVGGPFHKLKYRIAEPLPDEWPILLPKGGLAIYRKTEFPEKKRWPVMYVFDEGNINDNDSSGDERARRLDRARKTILFGPRVGERRTR